MDEVERREREPRLTARRATVSDVMSTPVVTIQASQSLWAAVEMFLATGMRHLIVLSGRRCVGVVSDRHVIAAWPFDPLGMRRRRVGEVLREEFPAVVPGAPAALVAELMVEHGIDAVPVVDADAAVVGAVTNSDLVRMLAETLR